MKLTKSVITIIVAMTVSTPVLASTSESHNKVANSEHSVSTPSPVLVGDSIDHVVDTLLAEGWKPISGIWIRGNERLHLTVIGNKVTDVKYYLRNN